MERDIKDRNTDRFIHLSGVYLIRLFSLVVRTPVLPSLSLLLAVFLLAGRNQSSDEAGCVSILAISLKIQMISS